MPVKHEIADDGPAVFGAVYFEIEGGKTVKVEQILREVVL